MLIPFAPAAPSASFTACAANPRREGSALKLNGLREKKNAQCFNLRLCFLCFLQDIRDDAGALHNIAGDRSKKCPMFLKLNCDILLSLILLRKLCP